VTGPNATGYPLVARTAARLAWQHIVAVYDDGLSSFYIDGARWPTRMNLRQPTIFLGLGNGAAAQVAGAVLLVFWLGMPLSSLLQRRVRPSAAHVLAGGIVLGLATVPSIAAASWPQEAIWLLLRLALATAVAYALAFAYVCRGGADSKAA
jgi:hypothetical protein